MAAWIASTSATALAPRRPDLRPEQRAALQAAKLRALVVDGFGQATESLTPRPFAPGAGATCESTGWNLVAPVTRERDLVDAVSDDVAADPNPRGWLGGSIVWASRAGVDRHHVLLDAVSADDARRAVLFRGGPTLWRIEGRSVVEVGARPFVEAATPDAVAELFGEVIVEAGAEAVVDHGVLRDEHLGLELGRVVAGEDGVPRLDVGVGKHDRLANAMLGHDRDVLSALRNALAAVAELRRGDAPPHPANQLAPERWLRSIVVATPSLAGIDSDLRPVEGTEPAVLKRPSPSIAVGDDVVVACSVGTDLDALAFAADARARYLPDAELVLVLPEPDALPAQLLLAARVPRTRIANVAATWRSL